MAIVTCPAIVSLFSPTSTTLKSSPLGTRPNNLCRVDFIPIRRPRVRILQNFPAYTRRGYWATPVCCFSYDDSQSPSEEAFTEARIDLKLPRRRLLVQFTCNACGERTERLVNRIAYERGTVFVQCAGCLQHHKLVDNLGLVVEYDLREDNDQVQGI